MGFLWDEFGYLFEKYDLQNLWVDSLALLDDITLFAENLAGLQQMVDGIHIELLMSGLCLNLDKVK